jgi:hypothetical protein
MSEDGGLLLKMVPHLTSHHDDTSALSLTVVVASRGKNSIMRSKLMSMPTRYMMVAIVVYAVILSALFSVANHSHPKADNNAFPCHRRISSVPSNGSECVSAQSYRAAYAALANY